MNEHLLDTDILSFYMKGDQAVANHARQYLSTINLDYLTITEITYYEIRAGLEYVRAKKKLQLFEDFITTCRVVKLTTRSLDTSANRYGQLRRTGTQIGTPDLLIAGIAIANNFVLVTNNEKHYKPIAGLQITNWKQDL